MSDPENDCMRFNITLSITIISCTLFIVFGIVNVIIGKYFAGIPEIIFGSIGFISNLYILLIKKKYIVPASTINLLSIFLSLYLYWDGGLNSTGIYWCLAFPALFVSTGGVNKGAIWVVINISSLCILFILSKFSLIRIAYNEMESLAALIVYGFSCYILFTYERNRNSYQKEIRRLNEMLPICSFCKKIRDKDGTWHSLESYLNREADIDFSHGVCPECGIKHYPEYLNRDK